MKKWMTALVLLMMVPVTGMADMFVEREEFFQSAVSAHYSFLIETSGLEVGENAEKTLSNFEPVSLGEDATQEDIENNPFVGGTMHGLNGDFYFTILLDKHTGDIAGATIFLESNEEDTLTGLLMVTAAISALYTPADEGKWLGAALEGMNVFYQSMAMEEDGMSIYQDDRFLFLWEMGEKSLSVIVMRC